MPVRKYSMANTNYRYGFNGQEKSDEIKGEGNSYTAEFWEYDPRIGRRWNLDPKPTIGISQYSAFNNNPIFNNDIKGDTIFRPPWMQHTFEDPLKMVLYKTPLGKQLLDEYSKSTTENIYFYAFDLDKSSKNFKDDNQAILNTVNDAQLKGTIDSKGNLTMNNWDAKAREGGEQQLKYLNASGFNFNTSAAISIVGLNTTDNQHLGYDKYDLAFAMYHEIYAHVKLGKTLKNGGSEHSQFGNTYYTKGMGLYDEDIVGGTLMVQGSPAWKFFKQLLELKIKNGDGTSENKSDLKKINQVDADAAKAAASKDKKKGKKG
jgi:hypothetical protein